MDVSGIQAGEQWPKRLEHAMSEASVVLIVIGSTWLRSADQYGRRRLDLKTDWVRREVQSAFAPDKKAIPLLVGGIRELPKDEALPNGLRPLLDYQHYILNDDRWDQDVQSLSSILAESYGLRLLDQAVILPLPEKANELALSDENLFFELKSLPGWEPVETSIPRDYPKSRHELRRGLRFDKFKHAIAFLQMLVDPLNKIQHHPRIENQWRTVFIHFTTWDIGNRITALDVQAAHIVNDLYEEFCNSFTTQEIPSADLR